MRPVAMTADELVAIRRGLQLTQVQFAKALGVSLRWLRGIEQGDPEDPVKRTVALAVRALQAGLTP